jgi:hypothetical protein
MRPGWAVVLDGATAPEGVDSGCIHDVSWLVSHLAAAITRRMLLDGGGSYYKQHDDATVVLITGDRLGPAAEARRPANWRSLVGL